MESSENMPLNKEDVEPITFDNSKILQIFELCLEPNTKEDLDNILLNFQEKIKIVEGKAREFFSIFDYVCMYVLDYVYNHDTASFCSVSRALSLYQMLDQSISEGDHRSLTCCGNDCLLNILRKFTNLYVDSDSEDLLVEVGLSAILNGNLGLTLYLIKFRLIEIPSEVNEKSRKIFKVLVNTFNSYIEAVTENLEDDDMETPVSLDDLLKQVEEKESNINRSVLTFCILTIVAQYKMQEKLEEDLKDDFEEDFEELECFIEDRKKMCLRNLLCVNIFIHATIELQITFRDIENFTEVFLNPFVTAELGKSLVDTCRKLLDDSHNYYNPSSLKDLARLKVRSNFQNSMSIPQQVNKLDIPVALKEFLNFHGQGIWKLLVNNHINLSLEQELRRRTADIQEELENGDVDVNMQELEEM